MQCYSCSVFTVCATCNVIPAVNYVLYFYISTSRSLCAVANMVVFCSSLISCFPDMLLRYCMSDFEMAPVAPIITGVTFIFFYSKCAEFLLWSLYIRRRLEAGYGRLLRNVVTYLPVYSASPPLKLGSKVFNICENVKSLQVLRLFCVAIDTNFLPRFPYSVSLSYLECLAANRHNISSANNIHTILCLK